MVGGDEAWSGMRMGEVGWGGMGCGGVGGVEHAYTPHIQTSSASFCMSSHCAFSSSCRLQDVVHRTE